MRQANFPQACPWPKSKAPSQNGTHGLTHAYAGFPTWVQNTPSHIGASFIYCIQKVMEFTSLRCSKKNLELILTQCVPWKIPMCSHGFSLPFASLSSTMWKCSPLNKTRQVPRPSVVELWRHEGSLPFQQAKHPQPSDLRPHQNS